MDTGEHEALYGAFRSKDSRFDGRFFVGVASTKIYCRPVCRARLPREENCQFFRTAAEAEKAGFRPCLICRPELAPGMSPTDAKAALAVRAARYIEENCMDGGSLEALAARLGYTGRHLRRVFFEEYNVSPVEYMQTCRLLLSKNLLTDTDLPVTDVALAAGFGSVRRLNALFRDKYRLSPTGFRKQLKSSGAADAGVSVSLGYRPPYEWERMLRFLGQRAIPGVECVLDGEYRTVVRLKGRQGSDILGWMRVKNRPEKSLLTLTVSEGLLPVLPQLLGRVRDLFDLCCDPDTVRDTLRSLDIIKPGAFAYGLRVPGCIDPFALCVRAVLGQQITVKAAGTLAGKLACTFGTPVDTGMEELRFAFPAPEDILALGDDIEEQLGRLGVIAARARAILSIAKMFASSPGELLSYADPEAAIRSLTDIDGVGPWTATYIAMRALRWTDALPETDLGIRKALGGIPAGDIRALCEQWRPWRSYAAMALWDSLCTGDK